MPTRRIYRSENNDLAALVAVLRAKFPEWLRASNLKELTGGPKARVRGLLTGVDGITMDRKKGSWWYQADSAYADSPISSL